MKGEAGVDLVDEPIDQVGLAPEVGVEGVGGDPETVGQAVHGTGRRGRALRAGRGLP
jgi:hypothetical protein